MRGGQLQEIFLRFLHCPYHDYVLSYHLKANYVNEYGDYRLTKMYRYIMPGWRQEELYSSDMECLIDVVEAVLHELQCVNDILQYRE